MPEGEPPPPPLPVPDAAAPDAPPRGPLVQAWFTGVLEGRRGDDDALRRATAVLDGLGLARLEPELDGRRFRVWAEERRGAKDWDERALQRFADALGGLVASSSDPCSVESNLRCVRVHRDRTLETLFAVQAGRVRAVTRARPTAPADLLPGPDGARGPLWRVLGPARTAGVAVLLVGVAAAAAFRAGWVDRVLARDAAALEQRPGPFGERLALEVDQAWGRYLVRIRRGPRYPRSSAEAEADRATAGTPLERASLEAVLAGRPVQVSLLDASGRVLASREASLATLLADEEATLELELDGFRAAAGIALSLGPPAPPAPAARP